MPHTDIQNNLSCVHTRVLEATKNARGRGTKNAPNVTLIAVSKQQPEDRIIAALDTGHRIYGENRVQEAQKRWAHRKDTYPDLQLHLIGPLQSNKAQDAVALFDVIHTVDREKIARALSKEMKAQNKSLECFIQINTGLEDQKSGIAPQAFGDFLTFCKNECGLNITGVMCIPPFDEPPEPHFEMLYELAQKHNLPNISMGMSSDYEAAIACGATHVRVGTGIFGARP